MTFIKRFSRCLRSGILLTAAVSSGAYALDDQQQSALRHLLLQDCGSCHGMTLKGGLGPALLPERMREMGLENIKAVIKYGRPGTAMPPWQALLQDDEIDYLSQTLLQGIQHEQH
ncbi:MAG: cytochrome c [Oceanospirillaceae bacterium]|nr:cytochrome c [Oceanospirillaceae bacterium]MCP5351200.1 cytochrome c [Oceanospirillaceae bacterium]